jgi:3-oxoacyl-[acyl-carrier-protein] synthase-3
MGHYHPDTVIDNAFLESLDIGTNDQWIMERVGIKERRTVLDLNYLKSTFNKDPRQAASHASHRPRDTAYHAAKLALKRAGLTETDIGLVIAGGCSPEFSLPANACLMAQALGIKAPAIDLGSACSTFAAQMHFINQMEKDSSPDYILLIQAENWTKTIDYSDRRTSVLIGDGTAATIVSKKHISALKVTQTCLFSDPEGWEKVQTPTGGHFYQEGPAVQKFAIKKTIETFRTLQENMGADLSQHYFIGHQANLTMLQSVCQKLAIDTGKHLFNVDNFGNTGAAGAPSVLSQHLDTFQTNDLITLIVVGAGLTWGGLNIEVSKP